MNQPSDELQLLLCELFTAPWFNCILGLRLETDGKASVNPARTALDPFAVLEILTSWQVHHRLSECAF
jgi:hypothetical protein